MKNKTLFTTLMALASLTAGYAQTLNKAKLDSFFDRLAEKNKAMGSLTIAKEGTVLYSRSIGYGQLNGADKKPLTATSRYRIASITKMYTATMILQLVEEGKLKQTDLLSKFFPQVPNAEKITIGQLLWHRSGVPNVRRGENTSTMPITKEETLAGVPRQMALQLKPPYNFALEKSLRRHVQHRTATASELWRDLNSGAAQS